MSHSPKLPLDDGLKAELIGKQLFSCVPVVLYGTYRLFHDGFGIQGSPHSYILVIGGILSTICAVAYAKMILSESTRHGRSPAIVLGGFVPYVFALYVIGYLGLMSLWKQITSTVTIGGLMFGVVWLVVGYWILHSFWIVTELGNARQISN